MYKVILIGFALTIGLLAQEAPLEKIETLDLCVVAKDFDRYAGKLISVRGIYVSGAESTAMYGIACVTAPVFDETQRPVAAVLRRPRLAEIAGARVDVDSIKRLEHIGRESPRRDTNIEIRVEILGRLNSRREVPVYEHEGRRYYMGFGHLGSFTFELTVVAVRNIAIVNKPPAEDRKSIEQ
jgi:hypothetical protein